MVVLIFHIDKIIKLFPMFILILDLQSVFDSLKVHCLNLFKYHTVPFYLLFFLNRLDHEGGMFVNIGVSEHVYQQYVIQSYLINIQIII